MQTSKLRNRKSLLSILLTLAMVISMLPTLAIPISAAPEVKIAFDPPGPGPIEVTAVEFDYETEVTQTVKVVNDGDDPTGVITIGIDSSANPDCFKWAVGGSSIEDVNEISTEDIPEFNTLGDEVEITVILITDCDPGTYTATINVTSVAGLNDSIDIIFTINPEPVVSISLTPSEEEITVVEDGYGPEASIVVAVENVGNVPTGALTADIESDDLDCFEWAIGSAPFAPATVPNDMASIPSLAVSGTSTITITLIPGCTPGIYIAFITVSNADVSAMSVPLVFKVNANPTGNANYTVRYNTGEGNPAISDKQGVAWTDANLLPTETLTRAGYEFGGWYTEPNGGGYQVTNNTTYSQLANHNVEIMSVDIYANWVGTVPTLAVGSVVGVAGKTISVPVTASDSPLLASLKFDVNYDTDALILTDLTLPSNSGFSALIGPDPGQDMISLVPNRTDSINPNGALLTLTFEISENAVLSEYLISLQNIKASDEKDIKIQFSVEDGSVKVVRYGDFTGNREVDGNDILWINRYIQSLFIFSEMIKTWATPIITFCEPAADFTNSGGIDGTDIIWIHRYIAANENPQRMVSIWPTSIDFSHIGVENNVVSPTVSIQSAALGDSFVYMIPDKTDVPTGETFNLAVGVELLAGMKLSTLWITLDYDQSVMRLVTGGISYPSNLTSASAGPFYFVLSPIGFDAQGSGDVIILTFEVLDDSKETAIGLTVNRASNPDDMSVILLPPNTVVNNHTATLTVTSIKIDAPAQVTVSRMSTFSFTVTLNPGATSDCIIWSITPAGFASVNPTTGEVVTQNKAGTVMLTATDTASGLSSSVILRII